MHDPFAPVAVRRSDEPLHQRPQAEQIRVDCIFHRYPPEHGAGAEWMAHTLLRDLSARGHKVNVYLDRGTPGPVDFEGVSVDRYRNPSQVTGADLVLTHLDLTRHACIAAAHGRLPLVHMLHNDNQLQHHHVRRSQAQLCISNSRWIRNVYASNLRYADWPMAVVPPPVEPEQYAVTRAIDDRVTLMNLSEAKGGPLFWRLATAMPHRKFLAVRGAYARQDIPEQIPENVLLIANTPDVVGDVYSRTKVLLMPSSYESWGRCAVEAACSGIPTIAHPTEGLVESLGSSGIWRNRGTDPSDEIVASWARAIDELFEEPGFYARKSAEVYARACDLDPKLGDFDRFERLLISLVRGDDEGLQKDLAEVAAPS